MVKPLVFVAMPFGKKKDSSGQKEIDFDKVYKNAIEPAVKASGYDVIRADEEQMGGFIHLPMYERLLAAEYIIADLTFANANVYYELGIRHAAKPKTTIMLFAENTPLLFDVRPLRALSYSLNEDGELSDLDAQQLIKNIQEKLNDSSDKAFVDSPIFQLIPELEGFKLSDEQLKSFKNRAKKIEQKKQEINIAKKMDGGKELLLKIEESISPIETANSDLLFELFIAYRDIKAWDEMIALEARMNEEMKESKLILEQFALALNRRKSTGDVQKAEEILKHTLTLYGENAETCGILGRIYKDKYDEQLQTGNNSLVNVYLDKAINAYRKGFQVDPREYYPGINAAMLLFMKNDEDSQKELDSILEVIKFILNRNDDKSKDCWEVATLLQIYCMLKDWDNANKYKTLLMSQIEFSWMNETIINDLKRIYIKLESNKKDVVLLNNIIKELEDYCAILS
ncbi:TRAFs-binding domain-containing protein [Lysinibacillus capsici]|uniref:TRAFs-binding domain-containing protein n=1 Tax=Lysinibacillus capsici TaxID=2115968 RepID=UPI002E1FB6E0|nr:TRAFs-binding domain-containing protein [Lysinibacillus capsici]